MSTTAFAQWHEHASVIEDQPINGFPISGSINVDWAAFTGAAADDKFVAVTQGSNS